LLFCDSKDKVDCIFSLNRYSFGDIVIQLDNWIPEAGRSRVLAGEKVTWVTIRGIPIHLRSSDLFRQLGSACGIYLGFEVCSSLSSVRLKIRRVGSLSEVVTLYFEGRNFPIQVTPDRDSSPIRTDPRDVRPNGKAVLPPPPPSTDFLPLQIWKLALPLQLRGRRRAPLIRPLSLVVLLVSRPPMSSKKVLANSAVRLRGQRHALLCQYHILSLEKGVVLSVSVWIKKTIFGLSPQLVGDELPRY
ncbi:hypothetical protein LINPERHAP2_LOCUS1589, partial [Linum perenne]